MENEQEQERRRSKLFSLVHHQFLSDTDWVAAAILERTSEKVSIRTIQAWLIQPNRRSSRNCPEWAIKALEEYVQDSSNQARFKARKELHQATVGVSKSPLAWSNEVRASRAVEFATNELEDDERNLAKYQKEFGDRQGAVIFELYKELRNSNWRQHETLSAIHRAFQESKNFDECREMFLEIERANSMTHYFVRDAKQAIEKNSEEFSDPKVVAQ